MWDCFCEIWIFPLADSKHTLRINRDAETNRMNSAKRTAETWRSLVFDIQKVSSGGMVQCNYRVNATAQQRTREPCTGWATSDCNRQFFVKKHFPSYRGGSNR